MIHGLVRSYNANIIPAMCPSSVLTPTTTMHTKEMSTLYKQSNMKYKGNKSFQYRKHLGSTYAMSQPRYIEELNHSNRRVETIGLLASEMAG
jgi:hypothetical protein